MEEASTSAQRRLRRRRPAGLAAAALAIAAVVAAAVAAAPLVPVASASAATHTTGGQRSLKDHILRSASMAAGAAGADGGVGGGGVELPPRISPSPGTDRCTTMIVGPKASADGSTMTTHTADCAECDFRLARVPARDWPEGAMRPVYLFASAYPRRVQIGRSPTWEPVNLDKTLPQHKAWAKEGFSAIVGHIPQVSHTYALIEGLYGIINEHQVAIGESTCSGRFWAKPKGVDDGQALLEVGELSAIALERCATARCAIQTMGDLATQYGYYGAQWDGEMDDIIAEAGEALTVGDAKEAWIFHILPDDTGTSAIWAAQRVPDGHISLVANQFVIRGVKKDHPDFLYSDNLWDAAQRNGLWSPDQGELDFLKVYGYMRVHAAYATRRVWRVFSLAAPSLHLPSECDDYGNGYPFSVPPDEPLTPQDLMRFQRDHYEGTPYDLTQGIAAGPYGDPNRYDPAANKMENVTLKEATSGFYERAISLFRTSYSTVTQSRDALPPVVGARVWVCQYMPAMSAYTPLYVSTPDLPGSYTTGSLFKYTKASNFWAAATVGNWASRFYRFIRRDVEAAQARVEPPLAAATEEAETQALALLATGDLDGATSTLAAQAQAGARTVLDAWNALFETLIAKYRDGYQVKDLTAPLFAQEYLFYPLWWLRVSGFFDNSLVKPDAEPLPGANPAPADTPTGPSTPTTAPARQRKPKQQQQQQHQHQHQRAKANKAAHHATAMDVEVEQEEAAPPVPVEGEGRGSGGGLSVLGAVVLAGCMSLGSLVLGVWVGRATALRGQYTTLRV